MQNNIPDVIYIISDVKYFHAVKKRCIPYIVYNLHKKQ